MTAPKISVIIPMFNAEKFVRQTLVSVLASKFADYELIVVDDCSTDNSVAEVEKLLPHFNGRLKVLSTEKNSGGAGLPRNIGLANAAGKYVTFVDNDDMILPTALGDFFSAAENFDAEVVCTEKFFVSTGEFSGKDMQVRLNVAIDELVDAPTFEPEDLRQRIQRDLAGKFFITPWGKFFRRDFLIGNQIKFPQMRFAEDVNFCFKCLCLAKKFLRVPHVTNIRREMKTSAARMIIASRDGVRLWLKIFAKNISDLDEFLDALEFFRANPDVRGDVLNHYVGVHFGMIRNLFTTVQPYEVPKIFFDELQNPALDQRGKAIIAAHLFAEKVGRL